MSDWIEVGSVSDIPKLGARVVCTDNGNIAVFRTAKDEIFAVKDECPHKQGQLSQGIVFGNKVACPLHNWNINLDSGEAVAPDEGCAATYPIKMDGDKIMLSVQPSEGCPA
ncbi:MAG TPA: nitrite reductase small subunit NirD [Chromatiaceae bacterium]|nr:nitrite reductase small subunit NirD [Chromatiaceae bacterium]HIB85547.1 nitrite reductase small subunit NirD [Chromatiaceae bacterium]